MRVGALLLASGRGLRLGAAVPKAFALVRGVPLVTRSLRRLAAIAEGVEIVLAVHPDDRDRFLRPLEAELRAAGLTRVVDGGATRQESMVRAFRACAAECELIAKTVESGRVRGYC